MGVDGGHPWTHHAVRHRGHLTDLTGQRSTEAVAMQILGQRGEGEEEETSGTLMPGAEQKAR